MNISIDTEKAKTLSIGQKLSIHKQVHKTSNPSKLLVVEVTEISKVNEDYSEIKVKKTNE